jgi:Holliday junction DNA helicase RuvA
MIATVTGEVTQILEDQVVIDVGGIGLLIHTTEETCLACRPGNKKAFHTYLVVREDQLALYGFDSMEERDLFVHLIGVAGIGPKTGLSMLSTLTPETIQRGIVNEQPEIFTRAPGIGKKTAQKIILELQGKIKPASPFDMPAKLDDVDIEVMEALTSLGYSIVEAQAALQSIGKEEAADVETRLRKALQYFS